MADVIVKLVGKSSKIESISSFSSPAGSQVSHGSRVSSLTQQSTQDFR